VQHNFTISIDKHGLHKATARLPIFPLSQQQKSKNVEMLLSNVFERKGNTVPKMNLCKKNTFYTYANI